jgi:SAM-dependent methyltransferase
MSQLLTEEQGMAVSSLDRAREAWDTIDIKWVRSVAWTSLSYISRKIGHGLSPVQHTYRFVHHLLAQRVGIHRKDCLRGAALVCGDMESERGFFEVDGPLRFREVEGYDLSSVSLQRYTPRGINFHGKVADCNNLVLPHSSFDLIVGYAGIHHVFNLGNLFYQSHRGLNDGGLFFMYEWIGPEYLQFPLANRIVASILLFSLFPFPASRTTHEGRVKGIRLQNPPETFDPSEACNSSDLLPQFLKYFRPIKMHLHGGLMYPIFEGMAHHIDENKLIDQLRIRLVYYVETLLTKLKIIKPLFVSVVGEKRQIRSLD